MMKISGSKRKHRVALVLAFVMVVALASQAYGSAGSQVTDAQSEAAAGQEAAKPAADVTIGNPSEAELAESAEDAQSDAAIGQETAKPAADKTSGEPSEDELAEPADDAQSDAAETPIAGKAKSKKAQPLRAGANTLQCIVDTPNATTTDDDTGLLTGEEADVTFLWMMNSGTSGVLALPVPDPSKGSYDLALGSEYTIDDTYLGGTPLPAAFGPLAGRTNILLIWSANQSPMITAKLTYPTGTTPDDTSLTLDAMLFEASGGPGSWAAVAGSGVAITDGNGNAAAPITLYWNTKAHMSFTKTVKSPSAAVFTSLQDRSYTEAVTPNAEDTYTVVYNLSISTDGSDIDGRVYMDSFEITDTLSGYLGLQGQLPQSIKVKDVRNGGTVIASTAPVGQQQQITVGASATTFSFDIPDVNNAAPIPTSRNFEVEIEWNKNAYTKYHFPDDPNSVFTGSEPVQVSNTAELSYKPVIAADSTALTASAPAQATLGWKQLPPQPATLTVHKKLSVSGIPLAYTTQLATLYEKAYDEPSFANGDSSAVRFSLTNTVTGVTVTKSLILGATDSSSIFGAAGDFGTTSAGLPPGNYTFNEITPISALVPADSNEYTISVSQPDPSTGVSQISISPTSSSDASGNLTITNTATGTGRISVNVYSLRRYHRLDDNSDNPDWELATGAQFALKNSSGTTVAIGVSDALGNIVFDNVPVSETYSLSEIAEPGGAPVETDYLLQSGTLVDGSTSQTTGITSSADEVKTYSVRYIRNEGGLYTGKAFIGPQGTMIPNASLGSFSATFHLKYKGGPNDGQDLPGSDFTISGSQQFADIIQKTFPQGSYTVVEDSLTIGGVTYTAANEADSPYALISEDDGVYIDIEAGKYDSMPYDATVSDSQVFPGPITGRNLFANKSSRSELIIDSRMFNTLGNVAGQTGTAIYRDDFLITNTADPSKTYTVSAAGLWDENLYRILLPAGTYTVALSGTATTPNIKTVASGATGVVQGDSDSVTITLAPGTGAKWDSAVVVDTMLDTTTISHGPTSSNTVVFVQAYVPGVSITKLRADETRSGLAGAVFTLYKLNTISGNYEKTNITATSVGTANQNNVTFANLVKGTYIAVETSVPAGFASQIDLSVFAGGTVTSVPEADIPSGITKFTVHQHDYASTAQGAVTTGNAISSSQDPAIMSNKTNNNIPQYTLSVKARDAMAGATPNVGLAGAQFVLYRNTGTAEAPVWAAVSDDPTTAPGTVYVPVTATGGMVPGQYKLVQTGLPTMPPSTGQWTDTGEVCYFSVGETGQPAISKWTRPDGSPATTPGGLVNYSNFAVNTAARTFTVDFGQLKAPTISFKKYGETNEMNGTVRQKDPISGGTFRVYWLDDDDNKQYIDLDMATPGDQTSTTAQTGAKLGEIAGLYGDTFFDPYKTYYLEETVAPPYQGQDGAIVVYKRIRDLEFKFVLAGDKKSFVPSVDTEKAPAPGNFYIITDKVDPYYIHITKLPVRPVGDTPAVYTTDPDGDGPLQAGDSLDKDKIDAGHEATQPGPPSADQMTVDYASQAEKEAGWENLAVHNAQFGIWQIDESGNLVDSDPVAAGVNPIQTIVSSTNGQNSVNDALSMSLPPGKYWIGELREGINYGPVDNWDLLDGGNKFNETSSFYVNDSASGMHEPSLGNPDDDNWRASSAVGSPGGAGFEIEITAVTAPNASDRDRTYELVLGDSNRYDSNRYDSDSSSPPTWIKVHAYKNGASRLPWGGSDSYKQRWDAGSGTWVPDETNTAGRLEGVEFSLWPAFFTGDSANSDDLKDPSKYVALPTVDNKPIETVTSKRWDSMESKWMEISRIFSGAAFTGGASDFNVINAVPDNEDDVRIDWETFVGASYERFLEAQALAVSSNHVAGGSMPGWAVVWREDRDTLPEAFINDLGSPYDRYADVHGSFVMGVGGVFMQRDDDANKNAYDTYGPADYGHMAGTAKTPEITNLRGIGTIEVRKERLDDTQNKVAGAQFTLYRIPDAAAAALHVANPTGWNGAGLNGVAAVKAGFTPYYEGPNANLEQIDTLTTSGLDGNVTKGSLRPGYYYLRETNATPALNTFGKWDIDYPPGDGMPVDSQNTEFGTGSAQADKLIGPIEISDRNTPNFIVTVKDTPKPPINIRNYWNNALIYDSAFTGTYSLTDTAYPGSPATHTAGGGSPYTVSNLNETVYYLKLTSISKPGDFVQNGDASENNALRITVSGGLVTAVDLWDGTAYSPLDTSPNGNVWQSSIGGTVTINVNHRSQGSIIIRKGGIDAYGTSRDFLGIDSTADPVPDTLTSATFRLEVNSDTDPASSPAADDPGWALATGEGDFGFLDWTRAEHAGSGLIEKLPPGNYRIRETTVDSSASWDIDTDMVYFDILSSGGAVYLTNLGRLAGEGQDGTAAHPVQSSAAASVKWFYNTGKEGTLGIWKLGDGSSNTNLSGATFYLYPTVNGTSPSAPPLAKLEYGVTTYYTWSGTPPVTADPVTDAALLADIRYDNGLGNYYTATVPGGNYLVRETHPPTDSHALRTDYVPVTVVPGENGILSGSFLGYNNPNNVNAYGFLNPPVPVLKVKKTAVYPAVAGRPEQERTVTGLPFTLYKRASGTRGDGDYSIGNFVEVLTQTSWPGATDSFHENGVSAFPITEEGEYRIVEKSLGNGHDYLGYNPDFSISGTGAGQVLGTGNSVFADYNEQTNTMEISYTPRTADSRYSVEDGLLTVRNPFRGFYIAAKKFDYTTGDPVSGAVFTLYASEADAIAGQNPVSFPTVTIDGSGNIISSSAVQTKTSGADGVAYFDAFYLGQNEHVRDYWIRETSAPSGYALDKWYDAIIKKVTVGDETGFPADGKPTDFALFNDGERNLPVLRNVKSHGDLTFSPAGAELLSRGSVTTEYTVVPQADGSGDATSVANQLPLYNYTVSDTLFAFQSGTPGSYTNIQDSAAHPGNLPSYSVNTVKAAESSAYASAAAQKAGAAKEAVWASVIPITAGGVEGALLGWQKLDGERTWSLSTGVIGFKMVYSQMDPNDSAAEDVYGNNVGDDILPYGAPDGKADYWVGTDFAPGNVSYNVTFDEFSPKEDQPEVSRINNTAAVSATLGNGATSAVLTPAQDDDAIVFAADERPKMAVTKTVDSVYKHNSDGSVGAEITNYITTKPESGDYIDYTMTLKNVSSKNLPLNYPVLIDYLEPDSLSFVGYKVTMPGDEVYTKSWRGEADHEWQTFANHSNDYLVWKFPETALAKDETIKVDVRLRINDIVPRTSLLNEAFGTSGVSLSASSDYPTGASFEAEDMTLSNSVYVGNIANTHYGRSTSPANTAKGYYDKLVALGAADFPQAQGYDLFVRAAANAITITPSSNIKTQKSVRVNGGEWRTDAEPAPLDVKFGDTVTYRLRVQTAVREAREMVLYDLLPYNGDNRNTGWSEDMIDRFQPTGAYRVSVSTLDQGAVTAAASSTNISIADSERETTLRSATYDAGLAADATAVKFDLTGTNIPPASVVTVEYDMVVSDPGSAGTPNHAELLEENTLKTAGNAIDAKFSLYTADGNFYAELKPSPKPFVSIRLQAEDASVSGKVWEDRNINGLQGDPAQLGASLASEQGDSPDIPMPGVTVKLHKYVGGTEVFRTEPGASLTEWATTVTDDGSLLPAGEYSFEGLESSYGTSGPDAVTYSIEIVKPTDSTYYFTTKSAGSDAALDSDVYGRESTGKQNANAGTTDQFVLNTERRVDAGLYRKSDISGKVWEDIDRDGQQGGEPGISGVSIRLQYSEDGGTSWGDAGELFSAATTGLWEFANLELPYGDTKIYRLLYDKDAVKDNTYLYRWTAADRGDDATDSDASPWLDDLSAASTDVALRYAIAGPNTSLGYAAENIANGAGLFPDAKYIAGLVWEDTDYDGISGTTDMDYPRMGITVGLYTDDWDGTYYDDYAAPIAVTQTTSDGLYKFFDSSSYEYDPNEVTIDVLGRPLSLDFSKHYRIRVSLPEGHAFTKYHVAGAMPGNDSDVMEATGLSWPAVGGDSTQTVMSYSLDAGILQTMEISGILWRDADGDGMKGDDAIDPTDEGTFVIAKLQIWDESGSEWSDVTGKTAQLSFEPNTSPWAAEYAFGDLLPGKYRVVFDRSGLHSGTEVYTWTLAPDIGIDNKVAGDGGNVSELTAATDDIDVAYTSEYRWNEEDEQYMLRVPDTYEDYDAGIAPEINTVSGMVWEDADYSGFLDNGEAPIEGFTVRLMKRSETGWDLSETTVTDAEGNYVFSGADGMGIDISGDAEYRVQFAKGSDPDKRWEWTLPNADNDENDETDSDADYVSAGGSPLDATADTHIISEENLNTTLADNVFAGLYRNGYISGKVWRDVNDNGIMDAGEAPITGAALRLSGIESVSGNSVSASVLTDAAGGYKFPGLKTGNYTVAADLVTMQGESAKWSLAHMGTDSAKDSDMVATDRYSTQAQTEPIQLAYAEAAETQSDAGMVPYVHISGVAWNDMNRNGLMDTGESAFPNIAVQLFRKGATEPLLAARTNAEGYYLFDDLLLIEGQTEYKVSFANPNAENYSFTKAPRRNGSIKHTATDLKPSTKGPATQNYHDEAHTGYYNVTSHSETLLNCGLYLIPSYKVTYQPNGGKASWGTGNRTIYVKEGRLVPNYSVGRSGFDFLGWRLMPRGIYHWKFASDLMPAHDMTLRAYWKAQPDVVDPDDGGGDGDGDNGGGGDGDNGGGGDNPVGGNDNGGGGETVVFYPVYPPEDEGTIIDVPVPPAVIPPVVPIDPPEPPIPNDNIVDEPVPLVSAGGGWSLLSLILSLIALAVSVGLLLRAIVRREDEIDRLRSDEDAELRRRRLRRVLRPLTVLLGPVSGIVWLCLDDLRQKMVWFNDNTPYVIIAFVVFIICYIVFLAAKRRWNEDDDGGAGGYGGTGVGVAGVADAGMGGNAAADANGGYGSAGMSGSAADVNGGYGSAGMSGSAADVKGGYGYADAPNGGRQFVNRGNRPFRLLLLATLFLTVVGIVFCIIMSQTGIPEGQIGGIVLLILYALPAAATARADRDMGTQE